jgi:hypothetical protein
MTRTIQVRDVPDAVHDELTRQAAAEGLSLSRFVARELDRVARRSRNAEILRGAALRPGDRIEAGEIVAALREEREHRS